MQYFNFIPTQNVKYDHQVEISKNNIMHLCVYKNWKITSKLVGIQIRYLHL